VANFGEWGMEGVGVPPDIEMRMDPKAVAKEHHPQLEAAVAYVIRELEKQVLV
jgi:tricorn protease